jgi:O-antigen/teichoic acid export membrane protein
LLQKIKELSKDSAIYGLGDVAVSLINFLLLPLYVSYLTESDYGTLALLGAVEVITKIVTRWGLDGSFMRFFYDCESDAARQRLASTIFHFLLFANGVLFVVSMAAAPWLAGVLYSDTGATALRLVLLNTFVMSFTFLPFHVLRMEKRSVQFSLLTLARSAATVVTRLILIVGFGKGVLGVVLADVIVTAVLMLVLARRFMPLIRPMFSRSILRESLAFGLPRLPHAAAQQVMAVGDKLILQMFRPLSDIGVYAMGVSFGLTLKLFLSAFESAWAPFYYATAREPDARAVFRTVTTYSFAALVLLTAGLSSAARDLLSVMTKGVFVEAAPVVGWTALAVLFQGVYLLTSIGLNLTKHTQYYPVATISAAAANVALNFVLIPRHGLIGAAWSGTAAAALQTGIAYAFSQRFYPMEYEFGRLARIATAGLVAYAAAASVPAMTPIAALAIRPSLVLAVFGSLLWITGFFRADEVALLKTLRRGRISRRPVTLVSETTELGGEIISTEIRDDITPPPGVEPSHGPWSSRNDDRNSKVGRP